MTGLTRRALLARAGTATVLAGAAGLWPSGAQRAGAGASAHSAALTGERRRRYAELVAAVAAVEGARASRGYVATATAAFSGWYSRNAGLRPMADHVLDEAAAAGGARLLLTDVGPDADPGLDSGFGTRGNRRRILAGEAFRMASPPFAPDRA